MSPIPPFPPLRVREADGSPNTIPVFELVVSNGTLSDRGGGVVGLATGAGGGVSGASTANGYLTFEATADLSAEKVLTAGSNIALTTNSTTMFVSASARTLYIPLALMTVQPDSANAFWTATNNTVVDHGFVRYVDGGEGITTWYGIVPSTVHAAPAWNLQLYASANTAAAGGSAIISTKARVVANASPIDATYTLLSSAAALAFTGVNTLNLVAASGGSFDSVLTLTTTGMLLVEINRHGGNAGDTINSAWDLYGVTLRANVL